MDTPTIETNPTTSGGGTSTHSGYYSNEGLLEGMDSEILLDIASQWYVYDDAHRLALLLITHSIAHSITQSSNPSLTNVFIVGGLAITASLICFGCQLMKVKGGKCSLDCFQIHKKPLIRSLNRAIFYCLN